MGLTAAWRALPDWTSRTAGGDDLSGDAPIVAPAGCDLEFAGLQADAEAQAKGGRTEAAGLRGIAVEWTLLFAAFLCRAGALLLFGGRLRVVGSEQTNQVALAQAGLVHFFLFSASRTEQIAHDQLLQFVAHGCRGWRDQQGLFDCRDFNGGCQFFFFLSEAFSSRRDWPLLRLCWRTPQTRGRVDGGAGYFPPRPVVGR